MDVDEGFSWGAIVEHEPKGAGLDMIFRAANVEIRWKHPGCRRSVDHTPALRITPSESALGSLNIKLVEIFSIGHADKEESNSIANSSANRSRFSPDTARFPYSS